MEVSPFCITFNINGYNSPTIDFNFAHSDGKRLFIGLYSELYSNSSIQGKSKIIAIDTATGKILWQLELEQAKFSTRNLKFATSADRIFTLWINPKQIFLEAYASATGNPLWQTPIEDVPKWSKYPSELYQFYQLQTTSKTVLLLNHIVRRLFSIDHVTGILNFKLTPSPIWLIKGKYTYGAPRLYGFNFNDYKNADALDETTGK